MKISATLIYSEEEEKKPLSLLISKSNGDNLPLISFDGIESVESKEFVEVGQFKAEEVLLFSVLDHPSSNFVISVKDVVGTSEPQVFHLASPQVTVSLKFSATSTYGPATAFFSSASFTPTARTTIGFRYPAYGCDTSTA